MIGRSYTVQLFHPFFPRLESRESGGAQAAWWGSDDKRRAASPTRQSFGAVSARQCTTSVPRARTRVLHVSISCPLVTRDHHSSISTRVTIVLARKDWRIPFLGVSVASERPMRKNGRERWIGGWLLADSWAVPCSRATLRLRGEGGKRVDRR